ncbi:von Willebrand factor A domain-containing protein 7-like isoform X3 [Oscarella lobularis]
MICTQNAQTCRVLIKLVALGGFASLALSFLSASLRTLDGMKLIFVAVVLGGLVATSWGFIPNFPLKVIAAVVSLFKDRRLPDDVTHKEMTKTALVQVAIDSLKEKFKRNRAKYDGVTDLDEIVKLAYGPLAVSEYFQRVVTAIQKANAAVDFKMSDVSAAHFDAENIVNGSKLLLAHLESAKKCIAKKSYDKALESVGQLLHGLQDFYSHTNWIEKGERVPNSHLATVKREPLRAQDVALPNYPTCVNCDSACRNNIIINGASTPLTSGYYSNQDVNKPLASQLHGGGGADGRGKCSHGGFFDRTAKMVAKGGINKDSGASSQSPHWYLHKEAADMATRASVDFLTELREEVGVDRFLAFLGLYPSYSFTIVLDTTVSMVEEVSSIYGKFDDIVNATVPPDEYVLVPFNRACAGPVYRSSSAKEFKEKIKSMSTRSSLAKESGCVGGQKRPSDTDHPKEKVMRAVIRALETSRLGSTVYVLTDSDAGDISSYPEALSRVKDKRINIFFIRSTDTQSGNKRRRRRDTAVDRENVYAKLAEESGGQVLIPDKDDEVGDLLACASSLSSAS